MARLKRFLWRGKLRKAATILVGGFVVLVIISSIASAFQGEGKSLPPASQPDATSTKVATPEATKTVKPTSPPKPSSTPEPPNAPRSTATAKPANTPKPPELTTAECDYLAEIVNNYTTPLSGSISRFVDLTNQAASDPTLIFDSEWKIRVATELAIWSVSRDQFDSVTPPSSLAAVHDKFLDALTHLDSVGTLFAEGVDEIDPDKISQATDKMSEVTALLSEAADLIDQFNTQHSRGC